MSHRFFGVREPRGFPFVIPPEVHPIVDEMCVCLSVPLAALWHAEVEVDSTSFANIARERKQPTFHAGHVEIRVSPRLADAAEMHREGWCLDFRRT